MRSGWMTPRKAVSAMVLAAMSATMVPVSASAQDDDARLRKIEAEVRALQRKVFPGGSGRFFTPEVDTSQPQTQIQAGTPSSTGLTDVLARLQAIESQLTQLTARSEENAHAIMLLNERVDVAHPPAPVAAVNPVIGQPTGVVTPPAQGPFDAAPTLSTAPKPVAGPSPARVEAVTAITKPASNDSGDDEYTYGFRLWNAGFFPESRQQLALFVEKYPRHSRISYGRNLLGRAFLDDGKPREAARYFLENYQANKTGARAPDSLLFLSEAMISLGDTSRACIALAEFGDTYPALATGRLKNNYERNNGRVDCS